MALWSLAGRILGFASLEQSPDPQPEVQAGRNGVQAETRGEVCPVPLEGRAVKRHCVGATGNDILRCSFKVAFESW